MRLIRRDGKLILIIPHHGSTKPLFEVEPDFLGGGIGPVLHFIHVGGEGRRYLMTLGRAGMLGLMRFAPQLLNEAQRTANRAAAERRLRQTAESPAQSQDPAEQFRQPPASPPISAE